MQKKQRTPHLRMTDMIAPEELRKRFPGGFDLRDEANALTAYAFRNGYLEDLHAGKSSPLTDDQQYSRITDAEMKTLMIEASRRLASALALRSSNPELYLEWILDYNLRYCRVWERKKVRPVKFK